MVQYISTRYDQMLLSIQKTSLCTTNVVNIQNVDLLPQNQVLQHSNAINHPFSSFKNRAKDAEFCCCWGSWVGEPIDTWGKLPQYLTRIPFYALQIYFLCSRIFFLGNFSDVHGYP